MLIDVNKLGWEAVYNFLNIMQINAVLYKPLR